MTSGEESRGPRMCFDAFAVSYYMRVLSREKT